MADVTIQTKVWQGLVKVAQRRRKKPEDLADQVLREFLERQADEELLRKSERAARRTSFPAAKTEELIRRHRRRT